jgi:endoglucanase
MPTPRTKEARKNAAAFRRRRSALAALLALGFAACAQAGPPVPVAAPVAAPVPAGPSGKPRLIRGMNLGNALEAPTEGEWGVVLAESDFSRIHEAGFDHVRLPVRFNGHADFAPPYTIRPEFLGRVDWAIAEALKNHLAVVVDLHNYEEIMKDPEAHRARFVALWAQIAQHYQRAPDAVCFELLNEPHDKLTASLWNSILMDALRAVRATNPTRTVILEGVNWASAKNLRDSLSVPDDPNVVASFHMYQPMLFTHQGAPWMGPEYKTLGVQYPGPPATPIVPVASASSVSWVRSWFERYNREPAASNPSGPSSIAEQLDMAALFAAAHHVPVYMGEFATVDNADVASRAAWTRTTRIEAERRGFGWAYWDDGGSCKAYDRKKGAWVPELEDALLK